MHTPVKLTSFLKIILFCPDYEDLKDKPFFPGLIKYMASGPVVAMVWQGLDAVKTGRVMLGATNPLASAPGTSCVVLIFSVLCVKRHGLNKKKKQALFVAILRLLLAVISAMVLTRSRMLRRRSSCQYFPFVLQRCSHNAHNFLPPAGSPMASFNTRLRLPPGFSSR